MAAAPCWSMPLKWLPICRYTIPTIQADFQGPTSSVDGQDAENPVRIMEAQQFQQNTQDILVIYMLELDLC